MKYIFIRLRMQNGEYRYDDLSVHKRFEPMTDEEMEAWADNYAANFYSEGKKSGNAYYFYNGEVAVWVGLVQEITEEEYYILAKYI